MKVAIYGQTYQDNAIDYVFELLDELHKVDAEIAIEKNFYELLIKKRRADTYATFTDSEGLDASFDMFVSFGGDGTILRATTYVRDTGIPIVGVNTGRLGFLSTFKFAFNEVTVSRKDTTSMITVETYLNNEYLTSYWADGLIISTPTGSTGYSLSCGGPVIVPTAKSLVLTPIAPHNLNARPLVISDETEIRLKVSGREENHLVSLDSRIASVANGTELKIRKAPFTIKMIEYTSESFLKTLRNKLLWGEDKRN